ncbi:RloB domain-containing protein [Arachidicoccus ginsenosidivorans]|uniref:RloB domain-containing protein n=1 Tax=Arachidicoccus ginsenosidivorans TaxID=496057 RepID=A0A5B8VRB6_9BACT|nr:RloB domain-containing protein [Arachidicoccus ginsenosidivorans]
MVGCTWSNEAFELWYLLHFQYYENALHFLTCFRHCR